MHIPGRMFKVYDYYWEDACEWLGYCPPKKGGGKKGKKGKKGKGKGKGRDQDEGEFGVSEDAMGEAFEAIKNCAHPDVCPDRPGDDRAYALSEKTLAACALWRPKEVYIDLIVDLLMYFHTNQPKGDGAILVFLPGWGDISKLFLQLHGMNESFKIITLHSLMTPEQQHEAFERPPAGYRKIVLSTNIAEASVTIDDIVYVIDCGVRKERTYDPKTGVSTLEATQVSRANAIQRRGRAGRVQEGLVVHLFPSYKYDSFPEFPVPAMLEEAINTPFCPLQEKFRTFVLRGLRNISEAP